jgi:hypothetical protein
MSSKSTQLSQKQHKFQALEEMMSEYQIPNMRSLVKLSDSELDALIAIIKLHEGQVHLKDILKDVTDEDTKIKILIDEIAKKLCRCIKKVKSSAPLGSSAKEESHSIPICINSIFHSKGISISRLQCEPIPMLIPKKGNYEVIRKYSP